MSSVEADGLDALRQAWFSGMTPDMSLEVSEWADQHRILSSRGASEAGPYRTARTPFMRGIMDALSASDPNKWVCFMKAAQVGATEAGNNWIGYCIHQVPGPFLAVQPDDGMAKRLSQQRLDPLIEDSPVLRALVKSAKSRDSGNTTFGKKFPGGLLQLTGAQSPTGLRSMPARYIFLDELDAYPGDVGGEGDPVALAEARTISFGHRSKIFLASTPTIKGMSRIEREFEMSDQRRYHIPCPHCGGLQWLKFERLRWEKGQPKTVAYICEHCEERIEERFKTEFMAVENGACWIPTADEETMLKAKEARRIGFHISGLYSPLGWLSWADIALKWEEAQGNEAALKTLKNTILGETWQEQGEAPDWQRMYERREARDIGQVPNEALVLTGGADVQRDRIEVSIWAWGKGLRSWLVEHVVLDGDTSQPEVWKKLTELLSQTWPHASGSRMGLARLAIDSGDGATTNVVYAWVRGAGRGQVVAVKGRGGFDRATPVDGPSFVEVTENGRKLRRGVQLWNVAVSVFKTETYRFLRLKSPTDEDLAEGKGWPNGYIHFPAGTTAEFFKQLTAEQLATVKTRQGFSRLEWQQMRERNEALDCRVYARAAAWLMGVDRWDDRRWSQLEAQIDKGPKEERPAGEPSRRVKTEAPKPRTPGFLGPRKKGWF